MQEGSCKWAARAMRTGVPLILLPLALAVCDGGITEVDSARETGAFVTHAGVLANSHNPEACNSPAPSSETEAACRWSTSGERGRLGTHAGEINLNGHYLCSTVKRDLERYASGTYGLAIYQAENPPEYGHTHFSSSTQTTHTWSGTDDEIGLERHMVHEILHKFFSDDVAESTIDEIGAKCSPSYD